MVTSPTLKIPNCISILLDLKVIEISTIWLV